MKDMSALLQRIKAVTFHIKEQANPRPFNSMLVGSRKCTCSGCLLIVLLHLTYSTYLYYYFGVEKCCVFFCR